MNMYMLHVLHTYVMNNFIPNSVFIGFICLTSPLCVLKCVLKLPAREETKSHLLMFDFSPLSVFKCLFKSPAQEEA